MNEESEKSCLDCKFIKIINTLEDNDSPYKAICFHDNIERADITNNYTLAQYCGRYEPVEKRRES